MIPSTPATEKEILSFFQGSGFFIHCYSVVLPKWSIIVTGGQAGRVFSLRGLFTFGRRPTFRLGRGVTGQTPCNIT